MVRNSSLSGTVRDSAEPRRSPFSMLSALSRQLSRLLLPGCPDGGFRNGGLQMEHFSRNFKGCNCPWDSSKSRLIRRPPFRKPPSGHSLSHQACLPRPVSARDAPASPAGSPSVLRSLILRAVPSLPGHPSTARAERILGPAGTPDTPVVVQFQVLINHPSLFLASGSGEACL